MKTQNKPTTEERAAILRDILNGKITEPNKDSKLEMDVFYQMTQVRSGVRVASELGNKFVSYGGDATADLVDLIKSTNQKAEAAYNEKVKAAIKFINKKGNAEKLSETLKLFPHLPSKVVEVEGETRRVLDDEKIPLNADERKIVSVALSSVSLKEVGAKKPTKLVNGLNIDVYRELFGTKKEPKEVTGPMADLKASAEDLQERVKKIEKAVKDSYKTAQKLDTVRRALAGEPVTPKELSVLHTTANDEAKKRAKELGIRAEQNYLRPTMTGYELTTEGKKWLTAIQEHGARGNAKVARSLYPVKKTKAKSGPIQDSPEME